jgi:MurNAc alpha-1-phosphate uridylyltransferase
MRAMILAAGYGTRLRPLTDKIPKALIEINGRPLIDWVLFRLLQAGFEEIAVNTHHLAEQIENHLRHRTFQGAKIRISNETALLDTGGGIKKMIPLLGDDQPILVHNVDVLSNLDLKKFFSRNQESGAEASLAVQARQTGRYLLFDQSGQLCGREHPEKGQEMFRSPEGEIERLAFNGIQVVSPAIFLDYPEDKFSSIDAYLHCSAQNKKIVAYKMEGSYWRDMGKVNDLQVAEHDIESNKINFESIRSIYQLF